MLCSVLTVTRLFAENGEETEISFGFILADASVTVTNMKYYDADGTLLYDQNDCYEPIGTEPVVSSVQAVVADTRERPSMLPGTAENRLTGTEDM